MTENNADYVSYLLRVWRDSDTESIWRVSLECAHTGERWGFAGLNELLTFLRAQTDLPPDEIETRHRSDEGGDERETA
jgi:hypothetical protein